MNDRPPFRVAQEILGAGLAIAGFFVALALIHVSNGFYHDDDICHYNLAVEGWADAAKAWHNWGRPGYTLPTMVVAHFWGLYGCRVFSALQMTLVAYLAFRVARLIALPIFGRRGPVNVLAAVAPAAAPLLVWAQPLAMQLATSTVVEVPAALYLTAAAWLYLRGSRAWSGAALSPLFITRYETLALVPIFAFVAILDAIRDSRKPLATCDLPQGNGQDRGARSRGLVASGGSLVAVLRIRRLWLMALGMLWAPLMYIVAAWMIPLPDYLSPLGMFHRRYTNGYGSGDWKWFLERWLMEMAGGGILAAAAAGALGLDRRARLVWLLTGGWVGLHTVIYLRGMFESGGYARFLVPEAGLLGALAAGGLAVLLKWRNRVAVVAAFAVLAAWVYWAERWQWYNLLPMARERIEKVDWPFVALLVAAVAAATVRWRWARAAIAWGAIGCCVWAGASQCAVQIRPLSLNRDAILMLTAEAVASMANAEYAMRPAMACHVLVPFLRPGANLTYTCDDAAARWIRSSPGTLYFWDSKYGRRPDCEGPLRGELKARGHAIWSQTRGGATVEVYERLPDSATQPASSP